MEAGFLNYFITQYNGFLIKKTAVDRTLEIRIPKFVWNSDNPDSNLKEIEFFIQLLLQQIKSRSKLLKK